VKCLGYFTRISQAACSQLHWPAVGIVKVVFPNTLFNTLLYMRALFVAANIT